MLAIIAVACCVIVPIAVAAVIGLVTLVKEAGTMSADVPFHRRLWEVLSRG